MHALLAAHSQAIAAICRRFSVARLEVFGSAARGHDFEEVESDIDLLVTFAPDHRPTLADLLDLEDALGRTLGREVDLVDRRTLEASRNYIRRRDILADAEPLYEAEAEPLNAPTRTVPK